MGGGTARKRKKLKAAYKLECAASGADVSFDTEGEREIRRCFEGIAARGFVDYEVKGFGPLRTIFRINMRADDTRFDRPTVDEFGGLDGTEIADGIDNRFGERGEIARI